MAKQQYLDLAGAQTTVDELVARYVLQKRLEEIQTSTNPYIFEIDYAANLAFNTDLIVGDGSSPAIGSGQVGFLIIAGS